MKKLLFVGGMKPGGAEHQMVVLAILLKKEGYEVFYLCGDNSDFYQRDLELAGIPIIRITVRKIASILKLNIPREAFLFYRIVKKGKYDTIISFLAEWNFFNCLTANFKKTRHRAITGIRNNRDEVFLLKRERFYTKFEKYTDLIVSNSDSAKNKYANYYPKLASKLTTIYNIVDLPLIVSLYFRKKDGKTNIIVPASYREVKNPIRMLEAVALMPSDDRHNLRIAWYGNIKGGKEIYDKMVDCINQHHLNDVVFLYDATTDIANRINEADMVGLFSSSEGLPNSICEGMMLAKPVIMTRVSDYNVLVDQSNGILCEWDNVQSIRDALVTASHLSKESLISMGRCSKIKAISLFSKNKVLEQWKGIL